MVYSWGVLHHTGAMWKALEHVAIPVYRPGGKLFIAIYNDQGLQSRVWLTVKDIHCRLPPSLRTPYMLLFVPAIELPSIAYNALRGRALWHHWTNY